MQATDLSIYIFYLDYKLLYYVYIVPNPLLILKGLMYTPLIDVSHSLIYNVCFNNIVKTIFEFEHGYSTKQRII